MRDLKGMRYLARLLADPGREYDVLDLLAAETGRAKEAYRRRLAEIEDDLEQARATGDGERAAQADAERGFLVRELAGAVGLGGRDRRAASASERARAGVTRAVRPGGGFDIASMSTRNGSVAQRGEATSVRATWSAASAPSAMQSGIPTPP